MKTNYLILTFNGNLNFEEKRIFEELEAGIGSSNSLLGENILTELVLVVTPLIIKQIREILIEKAKSKKFVKFKYKDIELEGVDEKTILSLIEKISESLKETDTDK